MQNILNEVQQKPQASQEEQQPKEVPRSHGEATGMARLGEFGTSRMSFNWGSQRCPPGRTSSPPRVLHDPFGQVPQNLAEGRRHPLEGLPLPLKDLPLQSKNLNGNSDAMPLL